MNNMLIVLNKEQQTISKIMETSSQNMFITGKPGTGKSELLKHFVKGTKKKVVVLAPTGVAALNVGGQTIHSFFKLPIGLQLINELKKRKVNEDLQKLLGVVDTIIVDEVSMVSPDIIDAMDIICKKAKNSESSFGGIQFIGFGDMYQLTPVIRNKDVYVKDYLINEYGGTLFFKAHAFENTNFIDDNSLKIYELTHIFRQSDEKFKNILNDIRVGNCSKEVLDILNKRVINKRLKEGIITLATKNDIVNAVNKSKLDELPSKEFTFKASIRGVVSSNQYPNDEELHLKVGSQIMMIINDSNKRWVNGSMGIVSSLKPNEIKVRINDEEYSIEKYVWKNIQYSLIDGQLEKEVIGEFEQYPIKLAWAMTIHKAQGQTYKSVLIDLGTGAFATGQTYVALSRCVSLETLYLRKPINISDIKVNQEVVDFMKNVEVIQLEIE